LFDDPLLVLRHSRSPRDILEIAAWDPALLAVAQQDRPSLGAAASGRDALAAALDAERRELMKLNEDRLECYGKAAREWAANWPAVRKEIQSLPLLEAQARMVDAAKQCLPTAVP
jgi:hypothetical protein